MFPTSGGPIQLNMEHDRSEVQVNIAMGSDAVDGNAFNVTLMPIALEEGIGKFCLGAVVSLDSLRASSCRRERVLTGTNR